MMQLKDWLPPLFAGLIAVLVVLIGKIWDGHGGKRSEARSYNDKVFSEMVALFDELKVKAQEAERSAKEAKDAAQSVLDAALQRVADAQVMVTDAHSSVQEAHGAAAAAQASAMEAQLIVASGLQREAEINRQLKAAWEKVDALDSRVRDMEATNAGLIGGALGLKRPGSALPEGAYDVDEEEALPC